MRCRVLVIVPLLMILSNCTSGTTSAGVSATSTANLTATGAPATSVTATSVTAPSVTATTADSQTKPAALPITPAPTTATIASPPAAGEPAAVTPEVVCAGRHTVDSTEIIGEDQVYFAYSNAGSAPVVIDSAADNVLTGNYPDDNPLVPTLFAPGRVSPAFVVNVPEDGTIPTWTLRGPDGVARTATAERSTPSCTDELLKPTVVDTRSPALAYSYKTAPGSGFPPKEVDLLISVAGVPATSLCAPGLTPQPALVWTDDGNGGTPIVGTAAHRTVPFVKVTDRRTKATSLVAATAVSAHVVDVCGLDGNVSKSWPPAASTSDTDGGVCIRVDGTRLSMDLTASTFECTGDGLPATGGIKIRSLP